MSKCLVNIHGDIEGDYEIIDESGDYVPLSVIEDIKSDIEVEKKRQVNIALNTADMKERYAHLRMESAFAIALDIIDRHIGERSNDVKDSN